MVGFQNPEIILQWPGPFIITAGQQLFTENRTLFFAFHQFSGFSHYSDVSSCEESWSTARSWLKSCTLENPGHHSQIQLSRDLLYNGILAMLPGNSQTRCMVPLVTLMTESLLFIVRIPYLIAIGLAAPEGWWSLFQKKREISRSSPVIMVQLWHVWSVPSRSIRSEKNTQSLVPDIQSPWGEQHLCHLFQIVRVAWCERAGLTFDWVRGVNDKFVSWKEFLSTCSCQYSMGWINFGIQMAVQEGARLTLSALDLLLDPQQLRQCLFSPKTSKRSPMHQGEKSRSLFVWPILSSMHP